MNITLNGRSWQLKGFNGEEWRWQNAHLPESKDTPGWHPASVPGSVQHDLWQAGVIPDPYRELNSLAIEWVPQRSWLYRRTFVPGLAMASRRMQLCFEGVDYEAEFFLNGESLGRHASMFTPACFDVTDRLKYGETNHLVVALDPAPQEVPQVGRTSRVRTLKARMNYGWDFCPRMIHLGIWEDVYLRVTGPARLADVWVRPELTPALDRATVHVAVEVDVNAAGEYEIDAAIRPEGVDAGDRQAQVVHLEPGRTTVHFIFEVADPALWWPNGYGDQPIYRCDVSATAAGARAASDIRAVTFGIRRVEFLQNDAPGITARPYTLAVNGRKVYIKGWNWVPIDVLYGVPQPEKLARLLRLVQAAHGNFLRVWGGGLIQTEAFYRLCDRLGILVWQEFIQSSSGVDNVPSEDSAFLSKIVTEAEQVIPRRRNHPSLAAWCGGNELHIRPGEIPLNESDSPVLAALQDTVNRLDPGRYWLPTSPSGPLFGNSLDNIERTPDALHDVHGPWDYQGLTEQYTLYNRTTSLLHSEFGAEGLANRRTLDELAPREIQQPVSLENPLYSHLASWWVRRAMWDRMFGPLTEVDELIRATQFTQAEGLRYAIEANRRRKWRNSGSLPWQFNEPYPNPACTSAVDYHARPKPAYYTIARAYAPVTVTAAYSRLVWTGGSPFEAEAWANVSGSEDIAAHLQARLAGLSGTTYGETTSTHTLAGDGATRLAALTGWTVPVDEHGFFLDLTLTGTNGRVLAANRYLFGIGADLRPLLAAPPTQLAIEQKPGVVTIRNAGEQAAMNVWVEDARPVRSAGSVYFDDNYFCLLPGESRTLAVTWDGVSEDERELEVSAWNAVVEGRHA